MAKISLIFEEFYCNLNDYYIRFDLKHVSDLCFDPLLLSLTLEMVDDADRTFNFITYIIILWFFFKKKC